MTAINAYFSIERAVQLGQDEMDLEDPPYLRLNQVASRSVLLDAQHRDIVREWNASHVAQQIHLPELTAAEHFQILAAKIYYIVSAIIIEALSLIAVKLLYPTTLISSYEDPAPDAPNQRPIVWVHGYLSNPTIWAYLMTHFTGERPQYTTNFPLLSGGVEADALRLRATINRSLQERDGREVDLVAHSRGGLVSIYYATYLAQQDGVTVKSITTIGTPHAGTPLSCLGLIGNASADMDPDSEFITRHKENLDMMIASDVKYYNIASEYDEVVPYSSTVVGRTTEEDSLVMPNMGHVGPMFSSTVGEFLHQKLGQAPV